jgi:HK97 family phage prohead protease
MAKSKDYIDKIEGAERRFFAPDLEIREEEESRTVTGYAAVFGSESQNLGFFTEVIERDAFDGVLNDDVYALFNHDPNLVLGRNGKGLTLEVDDIGLRYTFDAPNTTAGNDLLVNIRSGLINKSSFAFIVKEDEWQERKNEPALRVIKKVARLFDVSPVTYPAYTDTVVAARSFEKIKETELPKVDSSYYELKLKLNKYKIK